MVQLKKYFSWFTYKFVAIFLACIVFIYIILLGASSFILSRLFPEPDTVAYMQTLQGLDAPVQKEIEKVILNFKNSDETQIDVNLSELLHQSVRKICFQFRGTKSDFEKAAHEQVDVFNKNDDAVGSILWIFYDEHIASQIFLSYEKYQIYLSNRRFPNECLNGHILEMWKENDAEVGEITMYSIRGDKK